MSEHRPFQFTIADMLVLTTVVSLVCAMGASYFQGHYFLSLLLVWGMLGGWYCGRRAYVPLYVLVAVPAATLFAWLAVPSMPGRELTVSESFKDLSCCLAIGMVIGLVLSVVSDIAVAVMARMFGLSADR